SGLYLLLAAARPDLASGASAYWGLTLGLLLGVGVAARPLRGTVGRPLTSIAATLTGALGTGGTRASALCPRQVISGPTAAPAAGSGARVPCRSASPNRLRDRRRSASVRGTRGRAPRSWPSPSPSRGSTIPALSSWAAGSVGGSSFRPSARGKPSRARSAGSSEPC